MAYFVQRYGDWVLLSPPARGLNLLLWLAPFGAVAIGPCVVATLVRPLAAAPATARSRAAAPTVGPAERDRLGRPSSSALGD